MRKKLLFIISILTIVCILSTGQFKTYTLAAGSGVSINVNGKRISPDVQPYIKNGRTLVPLRGVFETLGADVQWISNESNIIITYKNKTITLRIDSKKAIVNNTEILMDVAPEISYNRAMIPLRFIAENMEVWVNWVAEAGVATITDPQYFDTIPQTTILGFTTNDFKGDTSSHTSLQNHYNSLNSIATFSYQINNDGTLKLTGESQKSSVEFANSNNIKPLLLVHNFLGKGFNKDLAHAVLSNSTNRTRLINNILITMSKEKYTGVNVDIENVYWYDRQYYSAFIKELKTKLTPYGYLTTVSIPAKTSDSYTSNNWLGAFDYSAIGKYADQILLMTYDEHYFGGSAGPIASYPWVENVLKYATQTIPPNKVLLGIAGYGYDWSSTGNTVVKFKNIDAIISSYTTQSMWDSDAKSPYLSYQKNGITHTVWYEDNNSISSKLELVSKYNLGGIGIWKMGYDDSSFWDAIDSSLTPG